MIAVLYLMFQDHFMNVNKAMKLFLFQEYYFAPHFMLFF